MMRWGSVLMTVLVAHSDVFAMVLGLEEQAPYGKRQLGWILLSHRENVTGRDLGVGLSREEDPGG
jgi:putative heme iron utilization protein